jgi:uncharacterized membrane protein YtjA (UPF0391 family)
LVKDANGSTDTVIPRFTLKIQSSGVPVTMLRLASLFLVAALSAALFGFTELGFSGGVVEIAHRLFLILLALSLLFLMAGLAHKKNEVSEDKEKNHAL